MILKIRNKYALYILIQWVIQADNDGKTILKTNHLKNIYIKKGEPSAMCRILFEKKKK